MAFTITLQTTDKGVYGSACVFGMCSELGLYQPSINAAGQAINNTSRYSFASTIFYIVSTLPDLTVRYLHSRQGYLAGVYPLAFLAQRFRIAKMTGLYTLIWGVVLLMSIVVKDYKGAYAQRFCLGLFEAGVSSKNAGPFDTADGRLIGLACLHFDHFHVLHQEGTIISTSVLVCLRLRGSGNLPDCYLGNRAHRHRLP